MSILGNWQVPDENYLYADCFTPTLTQTQPFALYPPTHSHSHPYTHTHTYTLTHKHTHNKEKQDPFWIGFKTAVRTGL